MNTTRQRRVLGVMASIAIAAAATLFSAGAASAAPTIPDPAATGSLSIHKHQQAATASTTPGNGLPTTIDTAVNPPLAGVTFSVQKLTDYDLSTNAGWTALSTLTPATAATAPKGTALTQVTAADGLATFANLPIGAYYVTETLFPAGVTPSAPFVVTIPMTNPTALNTWLYDVHVYPKNSVTTGTKTVEDAPDAKIGDEITFTITSDIPDLAAGEAITGYKVLDQLDTKLTYVSATAALSNGTALIPTTDYTVSHDAGTNTVRVVFTTAGLTKLGANAAASVVTKINTTVNAVGEIQNTATIFPTKPSSDSETGGTTTPPVITKWGNVTLRKISSTTPAQTLAGATFQVFLTKADADAGTNPVSVNGVNSWTTPANGELTITGLRYSTWANGVAVAVGQPGYQSYWLRETVAPSGYELLAQPVEVIVDDVDTTVDLDIQNAPKGGGFELPLTGGTGLWLFPIGGVLLLGGAAFLLLGRRKRSTTAV